MFKDIIWDFDGTLFDTYPGTVCAFKLALEEEGVVESEENILEYLKKSASEAIEYFMYTYNLSKGFVNKMKRYDKELGLKMSRPFPHAEEICRWIFNSGRRNYILTHRGYTTQKLLKQYNMEEYFTEIVTKHNGFKRKPDPEGYEYLIHKYGMFKETTLIVGDRELEILAAKAVGVKVCFYNTNKVQYSEKPHYEITSLDEVKEICES